MLLQKVRNKQKNVENVFLVEGHWWKLPGFKTEALPKSLGVNKACCSSVQPVRTDLENFQPVTFCRDFRIFPIAFIRWHKSFIERISGTCTYSLTDLIWWAPKKDLFLRECSFNYVHFLCSLSLLWISKLRFAFKPFLRISAFFVHSSHSDVC